MSIASFLYSVQFALFQIGGPILLVIGSISCILNLMVFTKSSLRKNPCTICFITVNIINLLFLYLSLIFTMLAFGYNINPSSSNIIFCRFWYYISTVLPCCQSSCLILASIERTLITSANAITRKRSTPRLLITSIILICIFWSIFHIHAWIFTEILELKPNYFVCYHQPGIYTVIITYYSLFINGIVPPALFTIFGCWTVNNVRQVRRIKQRSTDVPSNMTIVGRHYNLRTKDQQLIRMLFVDTIIYVISKSPLTLIYVYAQHTQNKEKSDEQRMIEQAIFNLTCFLFFLENSIGCYTNILVSKTFRKELKRILRNVLHSLN